MVNQISIYSIGKHQHHHFPQSFFSGEYDIFVSIDGKDKFVGKYDGQGSFGELALMYNMPRAATIQVSACLIGEGKMTS